MVVVGGDDDDGDGARGDNNDDDGGGGNGDNGGGDDDRDGDGGDIIIVINIIIALTFSDVQFIDEVLCQCVPARAAVLDWTRMTSVRQPLNGRTVCRQEGQLGGRAARAIAKQGQGQQSSSQIVTDLTRDSKAQVK